MNATAQKLIDNVCDSHADTIQRELRVIDRDLNEVLVKVRRVQTLMPEFRDLVDESSRGSVIVFSDCSETAKRVVEAIGSLTQ